MWLQAFVIGLCLPLPPPVNAALDWCHYFRLLRREHTRPECYGMTESRLRLARRKEYLLQKRLKARWRQSREDSEEDELPTTTMRSAWKPRRNYGLQECWGKFAYCRDTKICDSGQMCIHHAGYCCSPWSRQPIIEECPPPLLLNLTCKATAPVTWCRNDAHCHSTPVRLCCPTLCGYNICI